jgi:putative NADH-flavin reductase
MKVALIGASGFVGKAILKELLPRGHQVIAVVRHTGKLIRQENLEVVSADVLNEAEITNAMAGKRCCN